VKGVFALAAVPFGRWKGSVRSYSFHPWSRIDGERVRGAPRRAPDTPGSRPTKSPLRGSLASISSLQVGRDATSCSSRPQARVHAGLTWLVNSGSAILMPDPTPPTFSFLCFTERILSLWDNALSFTFIFLKNTFCCREIVMPETTAPNQCVSFYFFILIATLQSH